MSAFEIITSSTLIIIAFCEIIRAWQNARQLAMLHEDKGARDNAYSEFVKSLKQTDKEFVRELLNEFERQEGENDTTGSNPNP